MAKKARTLLTAAVAFASSPQGQRLIRQARDFAAKPENQQRARQLLDQARAKRRITPSRPVKDPTTP